MAQTGYGGGDGLAHPQPTADPAVKGQDGMAARPGATATAVAPSKPLKIDVVVGSYNYGRYLRAAVDSALSQSYPHVRVIAVDDGSTDDSAEILRSYGDAIVAVLKENGGQASAMNAGFAMVEGDVVIFLDADDMLDARIAEHVAEAVLAHPDAAKIQWRLAMTHADGTASGQVKPPAHLPLPQGDMRRAELTFPFDITWIATSGNAFPVGMLRQIMPIPEQGYEIGADYYLQHLPPLLGPVVSLNLIGGYRRIHDANAYEQAWDAGLDLSHIHLTIAKAQVTDGELEKLAVRLGIHERPAARLSVSDLANRLISLRFDPARHTCPGDTRAALAVAGFQAARRRFDVHPTMRAVFCAWFLATATAPRPAALKLARWFIFPEQRPTVNRFLKPLHRRS
ncbi:MAG TPA: glycosyltransferase family A protein [Caulobacteraceae bacterium]|nr:glycosyltransferase family A protein [Caulobacteraceae bacterium]